MATHQTGTTTNSGRSARGQTSERIMAKMGTAVGTKRADNRRENLRRLIDRNGGPKAFADMIGYRTASFLVQMTGPHPTRPVSEDTAMRIEQALKMPEGSLDWPVGKKGSNGGATVAPTLDVSVGQDILAMIVAVAEREKVQLPMPSFAEIASFAIASAKENGAVPSQETLTHLVKAMKGMQPKK